MTDTAPTPIVSRIKISTIAAADLAPVENWYGDWLGYKVCERGKISSALANSWGTSNMAERPYILMQPESGEDVFIRAVNIDPITSYKPMTSLGWNAFELIIDDVYALNKVMEKSPFEIIGPPKPLEGDLNFIHAMQVIGPANDVLYLTCDTTREPGSLLPVPSSSVGRTFIVILAGTGVDVTQAYYSNKFGMVREDDFDTPIGVIARAQGLPEDHIYPMGFMSLAKPGNFIEFDGYDSSFGARPQTKGQLPPGNALVSFSISNLDDLNLDFISSPATEETMAYSGSRTATFIGPAGELTEVIEENIGDT